MSSAAPPLPDELCLFPLGFHYLSLADLETVCVDNFPLSITRRQIFDGLRKFIDYLAAADIQGELWVDGSFLSEKIDPKDVDLVFKFDHAIYDSGTTAQRNAIDWINDNQKHSLMCDSYVLVQYPPSHFLHTVGQWWYTYWHAKWGFSREEHPKGIVVITLDGTIP